MKVVLLFLLLVLTKIGVSQNEGPFSITFSPKTGSLLAHRETMVHLVQDRTNVFELEFSRQDTSKGVWSKIFKYPSVGLSLAYQDYGNKDVLGTSFTVFRFTKFPIYQSEKWGFVDFRLGSGVSYITKKYNQFNNIKNIAIGSHVNGYINLQFAWSKHFKYFILGAGVDFAHISNASLKAPNQGLNTLTTFASIGYNIENRRVYDQAKFSKDSIAKVRKFSKWHFHFNFGLKQNLPDHLDSRNFGIAAVQGLYRKQLSAIWDAEFGVDLTYNEANRWFYEISPVPIYEAFLLGGYAGMALSVYNTQVYFGLGIYALNLINPAGWVYDRVGIRFLANDNWNFAIGIKAHIGVADYLEWGIGYRL